MKTSKIMALAQTEIEDARGFAESNRTYMLLAAICGCHRVIAFCNATGDSRFVGPYAKIIKRLADEALEISAQCERTIMIRCSD